MSKRLMMWQAIMAGAQILVGSAAGAEMVGTHWWAFIAAVIGAAQGGTVMYVHGVLTPTPPGAAYAPREIEAK